MTVDQAAEWFGIIIIGSFSVLFVVLAVFGVIFLIKEMRDYIHKYFGKNRRRSYYDYY